MISRIYLYVLAAVIAGCGSTTPSDRDARNALEKALDAENTHFLKIVSFRKTDEMSVDPESSYQVDFEVQLKCTGNGGANSESGCCYAASDYWPVLGDACVKWANKGDEIEASGNMILLKRYGGWVAMQDEPDLDSIPVYKSWSISGTK